MNSTEKIQVTHIISSPKLGGVQNNLLLKSKYDKKYNINRKVIYTVSNEGELLNRGNQLFELSNYCPIILPDRGFRPYRLFKIYRKWLSLFFIFRLIKILKNDEAQIIHSEDSLKLLSQVLASWMAGKKFIWQLHTSEKILNNFFLISLFYYFITNGFITMIADSKAALAANFPNIKGLTDKVFFIQPGIEISSFSSNNNKKNTFCKTPQGLKQKIIIGSTGRLHWAKGFEVLLNSIRHLIFEKRIKLKLLIAGEGPLRGKLTKLSKELGLTLHVTFLGSVYEIREFLESLDYYVQPSISEGFPVAVLEAMASKLPVICTDAGGLPELIQDGITGIVVKNNDVDALTNGIVKLLNTDENELKKMKEEGFKTVGRYSTETAVKKDLMVYKTLVNPTTL